MVLQEPLAVPAAATATSSDGARPSVAPRVVVACVAVLVVGVRWWTSHERRIFHITPDEPGQLAIARYLGFGVERWNMFDHSTWRPLFGTLLSQINWFTDDPTTVFRAGLVVNALLGGCSLVLLYRLARRLTDLEWGWCAVVAGLVSLAPATLFVTDWLWSESLAQALFLLFMVSALAFRERPSWRYGLAMGTAAFAGYTTHSRMLTLVLVSLALIGWAAWRHAWPRRSAAALATIVVVGTALSELYFRYLVERIWEEPAKTNSFGGVAGQITKVVPLLISIVGQTWYALITTAGLVGLGFLAVIGTALRRPGRPGQAEEDAADAHDTARLAHRVADARTLIAATAPLVGLSMLFMAGRPRPDQIVYGRYIDIALTPLVIVGFATLVRASRRFIARGLAVVVVVAAGCALVLDLTRSAQLEGGGWVRPMTLGLTAIAGNARGVQVWPITAFGLVLVGIVGAVAMAGRFASPSSRFARRQLGGGLVTLVLVVLIAEGWVRTDRTASGALNSWARSASVEDLVPDVIPDGTPVRYRLVPNSQNPSADMSSQRQRRNVYQFYLPHTPVYLDGVDSPGADSPFVFAPVNAPDLIAEGARLVWRDPSVRIGLWEEPAG